MASFRRSSVYSVGSSIIVFICSAMYGFLLAKLLGPGDRGIVLDDAAHRRRGQQHIVDGGARGAGLELVMVGENDDRQAFLDEINSRYFPNRVLVVSSSGKEPIPLLEGRTADGRTVAYVCRNRTCNVPATSPDQLRSQLDEITQFKK